MNDKMNVTVTRVSLLNVRFIPGERRLMSFRKMVVEGKVKQPNQMGVKLSTWEECYKNITSPSDEDGKTIVVC